MIDALGKLSPLVPTGVLTRHRRRGDSPPAGRSFLALGAVLTAAVALAAVSRATGAEGIAVSGITEPVCDVILSPSVPGIVTEWKFKEGDFITTNQVIIVMDRDLEELEAERRKLVMDNRKSDLDALQKLVKINSISVKKEELEKAETDYKIAVVEYNQAELVLRKRSIAAPCSGYIAQIVHQPGEACQVYQPLARVVDTRQCNFVCNIEAKAAARLKLGQAVRLEIETESAPAAFQGKVTFLSPVVDPASGLQKVKIQFDNAELRIRPGVAGRALLD